MPAGWCSPFRGRRASSAKELLDRGVRIERAFRDASHRGRKSRFAHAALELAEQGLAQERFDLGPRRAAPALEIFPGLAGPGAVLVDRLDELRQSFARLS